MTWARAATFAHPLMIDFNSWIIQLYCGGRFLRSLSQHHWRWGVIQGGLPSCEKKTTFWTYDCTSDRETAALLATGLSQELGNNLPSQMHVTYASVIYTACHTNTHTDTLTKKAFSHTSVRRPADAGYGWLVWVNTFTKHFLWNNCSFVH